MQLFSLGVGPVGNELGETEFALGQGQRASGVGEVNASPALVSKSVLNHVATQLVVGSNYATDPPRYRVIAQHNGTNWDVGGLASGFYIIQISPDGNDEIDNTPDWVEP